NHGGFFNPTLGTHLHRGMNPGDSSSQSQSASSDGPTSVTFGYLYKEGQVTFTQIDPAPLGSLPPGYSALHTFGHKIDTDAVFSEQDIVSFSVPPVTDQAQFSNLRIFPAEQDPLDPYAVDWADGPFSSPYPLMPDCAYHTL